jgi:thiosulfate/3-mercaptopyruvate sulfurtransferase
MTVFVVFLALGFADESAGAYPNSKLLVEPTDLAKHVKDYVVLDARPRDAYASGRVQGSLWVNHDQWDKTFDNGRDEARWSDRIGALGVDGRKPVVVLADAFPKAARIWFILRFWGVDDVRILNGLWTGWKSLPGPIETGLATPTRASFKARPTPAILSTKEKLLSSLASGSPVQIVDARSHDEYCGLDDRGTKRLGHLPGAKNLDWSTLVDRKTQRMHPPEKMRQLFADAGVALDKPTVAHCQGGGRSSVTVFAMDLLGAHDAANYYNSFGEWGNAENTPVVKEAANNPMK